MFKTRDLTVLAFILNARRRPYDDLQILALVLGKYLAVAERVLWTTEPSTPPNRDRSGGK